MSNDKIIHKDRNNGAVLGDVTNLPGKRRFDIMLDDLGLRSEEENAKTSKKEKQNFHFTKQICSRVDNLIQKNYVQSESCNQKTLNLLEENDDTVNNDACVSFVPSVSVHEVDEEGGTPDVEQDNGISEVLALENCVQSLSSNENDLSILKNKEVVANTISDVPNENKETSKLLVAGGDFVSSNTTNGNTANEACNEVCHMLKSQGDASENMVSQACRTENEDNSVGQLVEGCVNSNAMMNSLKACSCSFCLKVGYILSDLHFQDVKGRLSALKKSQKAASNLVQKNSKGKQTHIFPQGNFSDSSKLEPDLSSQWKSLFSHMENFLSQESSQLQDSFVQLRNLRESCKTDLERSNRMLFDQN